MSSFKCSPGQNHWFMRSHIRHIITDLENKTKEKAKEAHNDAVKKINSYFLLAETFPRIHDNTPAFIRNTENVLSDGELHILFFAAASQPVFGDDIDTDSDDSNDEP